MISIGKFLGRGVNPASDSGWQASAQGLFESMLETIRAAAVNYDAAQFAWFQAEIAHLSGRVKIETDPAQFPIVAELFAKILDEDKKGLERVFRDQGAEMRSMLKLMSISLSLLGVDDDESIEKLKWLGRDIDQVNSVRDIVDFKNRFKKSVEEIQAASIIRRKKTETVMSELERQVEQSRARLEEFHVDPSKDPVTGLPTKEDASNVISYLAGRDGLSFVMVLSLQQLPALNAKFGHQVGNLILQGFRDQLNQRMSGNGQLFRWGGKSFVAIFEKSDLAKEENGEMVRLLTSSSNLQIDTGAKKLLVPVAPKWLCLGRAETISGPQLLERIEKFASDL